MQCPICERGIIRFHNEEAMASCVRCNAVFTVRLNCIRRYAMQPLIDRKEIKKKHILCARDKKKDKPEIFTFEDL